MKFALGQVVMTRGIADLIETIDLVALLQRHANGDWGSVCSEDAAANERALVEGSRLLSAYEIGDTKIWVITEADRSATTFLLPDEY
jgi:hypothetical protein